MRRTLLALTSLAVPVLLAAQEGPPPGGEASRDLPSREGATRKVAEAVRIAGPAPRIDGRLDDPAWQSARFFSDLVEKEPVEGAPPSVRTEVGFLYDTDALYVGLRMYGDPATIRAPVTRRDGGGDAEHVWISLDTYDDHRTAVSLAVTAAGAQTSDHMLPRVTEVVQGQRRIVEHRPFVPPLWRFSLSVVRHCRKAGCDDDSRISRTR